MLRALPWIIIGGVSLVLAVIIAQLIGTAIYLNSPDRVVRGAFQNLIDARSVRVSLLVDEEGQDGGSLKVDGAIDKSDVLKPLGKFDVSFQTAGQAFYGSGELRLKDGQMYARAQEIAGLPGVLPGSLQSIWAGLNVQSLVAAGERRVTPDIVAAFTDEDAHTLIRIVRDHIPVRPSGTPNTELLENTRVLHIPVTIDAADSVSLVSALEFALYDQARVDKDAPAVRAATAAVTGVLAEVWVAKNDGTLRAMRVVLTPKGGRPLHIALLLSHYNEPVAVDSPLDARPLAELLARLFGPTLKTGATRLPFALPVFQLPGEATSAADIKKFGDRDTDGDGLSDEAEIFYGTNPFNPDTDGDGVSDGAEVRQGSNPRGTGMLFRFGLPQ